MRTTLLLSVLVIAVFFLHQKTDIFQNPVQPVPQVLPEQKNTPTPAPTVPTPQPALTPPVAPEPGLAPKTQLEWTHPGSWRSDQETWDTRGGRTVILRGCKEWRERDPKADC